MRIERVWAMPNSDTFSIKPIREFVERHVHGVVVDPFARNSTYAEYSNDLNPSTTAKYHMEAAEFLKLLVSEKVQADCILFDPPYSIEQTKRSYQEVGRDFMFRDTQIAGRWVEHKDLCAQLLVPDGVFLHFGWHSNGIGKKRGFEVMEVLLVAHGGAHNDTICIAEKRA